MGGLAGSDQELISEDDIPKDEDESVYVDEEAAIEEKRPLWAEGIDDCLWDYYQNKLLNKREILEFQAQSDNDEANKETQGDFLDEFERTNGGTTPDEWDSLQGEIMRIETRRQREILGIDDNDKENNSKVFFDDLDDGIMSCFLCANAEDCDFKASSCPFEERFMAAIEKDSGTNRYPYSGTNSHSHKGNDTKKYVAPPKPKPERAIYVCVEGKVQGVCFRNTVETISDKLGCTGWVKNMPKDDSTKMGDVEAFIQGTRAAVNAMIMVVNAGPTSSDVMKVNIKEAAINEDIKTFKTIYPKGKFKLVEAEKVKHALAMLGHETTVRDSNESHFKSYGESADTFLNISGTSVNIYNDKDLGEYFRRTVSDGISIS